MKKWMVSIHARLLCVYADTREEARKIVLRTFIPQLEEELKVVEVTARTERCAICQYTYTPSEIVEMEGERLCLDCLWDKYDIGSLNPADIPF
jgi:uncharacterized protein (UPF0212 family)